MIYGPQLRTIALNPHCTLPTEHSAVLYPSPCQLFIHHLFCYTIFSVHLRYLHFSTSVLNICQEKSGWDFDSLSLHRSPYPVWTFLLSPTFGATHVPRPELHVCTKTMPICFSTCFVKLEGSTDRNYFKFDFFFKKSLPTLLKSYQSFEICIALFLKWSVGDNGILFVFCNKMQQSLEITLSFIKTLSANLRTVLCYCIILKHYE